MLNHLWLIPAAPFLGFVVNGVAGKRAGKSFADRGAWSVHGQARL